MWHHGRGESRLSAVLEGLQKLEQEMRIALLYRRDDRKALTFAIEAWKEELAALRTVHEEKEQ